MDLVQTIALTMGVAWASGINLYAAVAMLGWMGATGHVELPPGLDPITHPVVIGCACFMYCVEFFADKVPGVDTAWDSVHTFIRIPAGAVLAAGAIGDVSAPAHLAAALLGGGLAATTHATKAGGRVMINTSPEPVSNWTTSIAEDVAVLAGLWVALEHPELFLVLLGAFIVLMAWLLPKLWRAILSLGQRIGRVLGFLEEPVARPPAPPAV